LLVQDGALPDVDGIRRLPLVDEADEIADLPLQTDVGHKPLPRLRVDSGQIPRVGIAIGVAVGDVEEVDEIEAVLNWLLGSRRGHACASSIWFCCWSLAEWRSFLLVKKSCRW